MPGSLTTTASPSYKGSNIARYGLLLVIFLALLNGTQTIHSQAVFTLIPLVLLSSVTSCAALLLLTTRVDIKLFKTPIFIGINCFWVLIFFSTLYSKYPHLTAPRSLQFFIVTNSLYLLLCSVRDLKQLFEEASKITLLFTLIACVYGIVVYQLGNNYTFEGITVTGLKVLGLELQQRMYEHRISSFVGNPNSLGVLVMLSIFFCLYFFKQYQAKRYLVLMLFFFYTLLLTGSRASMMGVLVGGALFINYVYLKDHLGMTAVRVLLIGLSLIIGGYMFFEPRLIADIFALMGRASHTLSGREVAWAALVDQIKDSPFFGVGYRISTEAVLEDNFIDVPNSHNLYLSILSEIGVLGFLFFSCLYLIPTFVSLAKKNFSGEPLYVLTAFCLLVAILINQIFEDIYAPVSYFFIWMFVVWFISFQRATSKPKSL